MQEVSWTFRMLEQADSPFGEPLIYTAEDWTNYKMCNISILYIATVSCSGCAANRQQRKHIHSFMFWSQAGNAFARDQLEGDLNTFFSGKAKESNHKHRRTGDRNRSDCIAATDNVAQAARQQEAMTAYGRTTLKGCGGKFH